MNNFAKGASLASLVFSVGIGIGLFFLRQYHKEKVNQAKSKELKILSIPAVLQNT